MEAALDILIVEDDADTRANLEDILSLDDYSTASVGTLREAFDIVQLPEVSCILLDRRLPDGTADEALQRFSVLAPKAAVIVVTGYADLESTIAALRSGVSDYILKPISPQALRASLARLFRLKQAEERAQQAERLAVIGEVVTSLAHESRNFLQKISSSAELLELIEKDNPEALAEVRRILVAERGLEQLLEELRAYAAPILLNKSLLSIQAVWRKAWLDACRARMCHAQLLEEVSHEDVNVQIDEFRMTQVFRNLFENSLAACQENVEVQVVCKRQDSYLNVTVRDNGSGLDAEQRRRVFQPFYTTKSQGTGLGMSIAKRIIESHGGDISVGNCNYGAEFIIRLPAADGTNRE